MELMSAKAEREERSVPQSGAAAPGAENRIAGAEPAGAQKPGDAVSRRENASGARARPFLKWAGGKGQLLGEIERYYPFDNGGVTRYAEPFAGGGAVLFDILNRYRLDAVYMGDINPELINTYKALRDSPDALIGRLTAMQNEYLPMDGESRRAYYSAARERFNALKSGGAESGEAELASLMIFLNRTCFNGLYRVNRKGRFNVPIGSYRSPQICDEANLRAVSEKLRGVEIVCGDYRRSYDFIDGHTFVYFDPPYRPLTQTANFTSYTETEFDDREQLRLAGFVEELSAKGAKILLSNSDPRNADPGDDFFDRIYSSYRICRVEAARMINSNSAARGRISELLISNF